MDKIYSWEKLKTVILVPWGKSGLTLVFSELYRLEVTRWLLSSIQYARLSWLEYAKSTTAPERERVWFSCLSQSVICTASAVESNSWGTGVSTPASPNTGRENDPQPTSVQAAACNEPHNLELWTHKYCCLSHFEQRAKVSMTFLNSQTWLFPSF